ncbi:MAG: DUF1499 domain-containing protein [Sediminimonas qiaohouensis]|uniref:DUF1499 domain-containing protein n=1 Tax=Sediminimonas qiaohouensis TaxID=552061 RepID=A0A7C9HAJ8_9RHOB|nr:DUF1499 domain-containing protein [Sediminimonas qiaohouensis]MTJ04150.1 DUF1499 domain-containing protein [Sediminimonas qiaohouensis]
MKWFAAVLIAAVVVGIGIALWVRLAPTDPSRWHVAPLVRQDHDYAAGVIRAVPGTAEDLERLDAIIRATPRTVHLAGSLDEGMLSYVTRSAFWGFPDYTTVVLRGDTLIIHARLRFGRSDMGVNKARVSRWLDQLGRDA